MSADELLWEDAAAGRRLILTRSAPEAAVALLSATLWGGGGLRYQLLDLPAKLARLRDPRFAVMEDAGGVACVFVLDRCVKRLPEGDADAVHFVMAATRPERRNEGLAETVARHLRAWCERQVRRPGCGFAYVEAGTSISLRISQTIGHVLEAPLPLTVFSRVRPRNDPRARTARPEELPEIAARLTTLYADHVFGDVGCGLRAAETLTLREGGRLRAAIAAEPMRWRAEALPGASGRVLRAALRALPTALRPIDPDDLRAVRFSAPLVEPGDEAALTALMETALARRGARLGLLMMDARCPVLARISTHGRLGPLASMLRGAAVMRADFLGLADEDLANLRTRPVLVDPADVI